MAGLCACLLARNVVPSRSRWWLLLAAAALALAPDLDVLPGLLMEGDPRLYHHQASHSLTAAAAVGILGALAGWWWKSSAVWWGLWSGGIYGSHVGLDLLVDDPAPPLGAQVLWPFSDAYVISPVTPFMRFDYFSPDVGMIGTMLSLHNLTTVAFETLLLSPFALLAWYLGRVNAKQEVSPGPWVARTDGSDF